MPRKQGKSAVKKAGSAIARTTRKLTAKLAPRKSAKVAAAPKKTTKVAKPEAPVATARPVIRESDVPMDLIAQEYVPSQTSIKTSFRSDGADHQSDQELLTGAAERFANEDHFTNKSGDARIGTHGRNSSGEQPAATANENRR